MTTIEVAKRDIQGFITSGYGHTYHSAYLFLKITDREKAKGWLVDLIPQIITAESWRAGNPCLEQADAEKPPKLKPEKIANIAFSMEGLAAIGLPDAALRTFPAEMQQGMIEAVRALKLGDTQESAPEHWDLGGPANAPFDMLLFLHTGSDPDDNSAIDAYVAEQKASMDGRGIEVVYDERGGRRADDKEHFGFKDGIAQPPVFGINIYNKHGQPIKNPVKTGEFILGYPSQYNLYPVSPALPREADPEDILPPLNNPQPLYPLYRPGALKDLGANGTYVVFRKLRQHVAAFWRFLIEETQRADGTVNAERVIWMASKYVGRWPNGDPIVPEPDKLRDQDEFYYAERDLHGEQCPFGSHLRRSNPRDVFHPANPEISLETTAKHRIIRRGRNFGAHLFDPAGLDKPTAEVLAMLHALEDDDQPRGLHFFSVNANIQRQFEFIQESWANNPNFNAMYESKDPLIGDNDRAKQRPSYMKILTESAHIRSRPLPRFVTVMGGSYLFMPSLTALRYFAS